MASFRLASAAYVVLLANHNILFDQRAIGDRLAAQLRARSASKARTQPPATTPSNLKCAVPRLTMEINGTSEAERDLGGSQENNFFRTEASRRVNPQD